MARSPFSNALPGWEFSRHRLVHLALRGRAARERVGDGEFLLVHVDTPLEVAEQRDAKGLYKKARAGQIKHFTGIDSPYEKPEGAELTVDTTKMSAEAAADRVIAAMVRSGIVPDIG